VVIISAEVIFALVQTYQPLFVIQRWQVFLVYMAVNTASILCNLFALQRLPRMGTFLPLLLDHHLPGHPDHLCRRGADSPIQ
jgi:hypothetical protein